MAGGENGSYYAVIPADVRYDQELNANAKLLYGELTSLCNQKGYCWAKNDYFAQLYGLSGRTISRLVSQLESRGYIRTETVPAKDGTERRIYAGLFLVRQEDEEGRQDRPEGDGQNCPGGDRQNCPGGIDKNVQPPLDKNVHQNNKQENNKQNIPPLPPTGGRVRRKKSIPSQEPERFAKFWQAYPRDEERAKAVAEWDKLLQDKELLAAHNGDASALLDEISVGLGRHLACEEWQRNVGIPYAFRWLRDRRWTEKQKAPLPKADAPASGGWAADPEVY